MVLAATQAHGEGIVKETRYTVSKIILRRECCWYPPHISPLPPPPAFLKQISLSQTIILISEMAIFPCMEYFHHCATATRWPRW